MINKNYYNYNNYLFLLIQNNKIIYNSIGDIHSIKHILKFSLKLIQYVNKI